MSNFASAAALANGGFRVFPVRPGEKLPLIKSWPEKATADLEQIQSWWTQWPDANVGVHTKDMLVVDIDPQSGGQIPPDCPATFSVLTPSGGIHLYYTCEGGVKNSAGKVAQGVDIRSDRGYVVGPGSRTPKGEYTVYDRSRPAQAPSWLVEAAGAGGSTAPTDTGPRPDVDQEKVLRHFQVWLDMQEPPGQGERNVRLAEAVREAGDQGVYVENVFEGLEPWHHLWTADELEGEVQKTIQSAYAARQRPVAGAVATDEDFAPVQPSEAYTKPEQAPEMNMLWFGDDNLEPGSLPEPDYLIKGWLDRGQLAMLFGKWSAGKTFAALDLALHVAAGKDWCGKRVRQGGAMLFEYEGEAGMRKRLAAMRKAYPEYKDAPLAVVPMRQRLVNGAKSESKAPGLVRLERALEVYHAAHGEYPALIVVDPIRDALGGSDSDVDLTAAYVELIRKLRESTGACILTLHHVGHGDQSRARGDSGLPGAMDVELMAFERNGVRTLRPTKERDQALPDEIIYELESVQLGFDSDGDAITSCIFKEVEGGVMNPDLPDNQQAVWEQVKSFCLDFGTEKVERGVIASIMKEAGTYDKNRFDGAWRKLLEKELLIKVSSRYCKLQTGAVMEFDTS